jgi:uncharacterized protein YdiU (UPF0061 family)
VLNTDNINVTGESFDYGPWRFLPAYDPAFTAAYFDETGLYAFGRQPDALLWNLFRLAECLLPLAEQSKLEASLAAFEPALHREFSAAILRRLGMKSQGDDLDGALARSLWRFLHHTKAPFEQTFFDCFGGLQRLKRAEHSPSSTFYADSAFQPVRTALENFEPQPGLTLDHAYFAQATPCTMLVDDVEALWQPIAERDDWSAFAAKLGNIKLMAEAYALSA